MVRHSDLTDGEVWRNIHQKEFVWGGNRHLKIYGLLRCSAGKQMKRINRVFFSSEEEAIMNGYRPCGCCCRLAYKKWKNGLI